MYSLTKLRLALTLLNDLVPLPSACALVSIDIRNESFTVELTLLKLSHVIASSLLVISREDELPLTMELIIEHVSFVAFTAFSH